MIKRDPDEGGFMRAIEALKMRGWRIIKDGKNWLHKCYDCQLKDMDKVA